MLKTTAFATLLLYIVCATNFAIADDTGREPEVDALLAKYAQSGGPGAAIGIYRDGERLYSRSYGFANLEHAVEITPRTVFNLASVSKQFAAFSIALLAREGKLDLQADIRTYLPGMADFGRPITVQHLVHHTSGLRDYIALAALSGRDNSALVRQQHLVNLLQRQRGLNFEPGSEYEYSNSGYCLLLEIVRVVSGQAPRAFMQDRLFGPLGMTRTRLRDSLEEVIPEYASGYEKAENRQGWIRALYNRETIGSGNVVSSVDDLAKWARHLARLRSSDPALLAQITTPGRLNDGTPLNYGFGVWRQTLAGRDAIMHTGGVSGFRALFAWFPADDVAIIVLGNGPVDVMRIGRELARLYLGTAGSNREEADTPPKAQPPVTPATVAVAKLATLAGEYRSDELDVSYVLAVESGRLILKSLWLAEPQPLVAIGADRFDATQGPLAGLSVSVQRDDAGSSAGLLFSYGGVRRLPLRKVSGR